MADVTLPPDMPSPPAGLWRRFRQWQTEKIASPDFQRWAAKNPLTRGFVKRDAAKLYDLVSGFVYSQVLLACVELGLLESLRKAPRSVDALALAHGLAPERMARLTQAAASVGLLVREADGTYALGRLGAAVLGVPGLEDMIRHHKTFYRDIADPVGLLRGETDPELSRFWPYVFGKGAAEDPETAATYSDLMATSQALVAEETLDTIALAGITHLADIGGGTGAFLSHVAARYPQMRLTLMDLPAVIASAEDKLAASGVSQRIRCHPGSFLEDPLPAGMDAISLIRVCYDHDDPTVATLLARAFDSLPPGGRLILSEPMSGGAEPSRAGDAYFGFYTMAMTTGRPRSAAEHSDLLRAAGFSEITEHRTRRPFLTGVVSAKKPL